MKTIFVTGGAGYVGSHCCKAFAEAGWRVVVYDSLYRGWRDLVRWGPLIEGDIRDPSALSAAMAETKPDAVAHFAALTSVGESVADPARYYETNTLGAFNVLQAMRANGVETIIFSSTAAIYGVPTLIPIPEDHPQQPINPYGWSKLFVERMLARFPDPEKERAALDARQATGRMVTPEEVAHAVLFLADPRSTSTTGTALEVDGGVTHVRHRAVQPPLA